MNRSIIVGILIAIVAVLAPASSAFADDPAPTTEQLEAAKKAFGEGKTLFDQGKFPEAIDKFKESYRLSRNPMLLYNIGFTLDQANQKDSALFYYRKFLADAPKEAAQRKDVTARVEVIEKEKLEADLAGTSIPASGTGTGTTATAENKVTIKPPGTYSASDFKHQMIDAAPPGKPLDLTAVVPEDSGFVVTLYYRGSGDTKFIEKTMKRRYNELVGRVPGEKVYGSAIQYYIDVKDQAGNKVANSGKATSPNLVTIDPGATPRFYPDLTEEGELTQESQEKVKRHDEEDPFAKTNQVVDDAELDGGSTTTGPTPEVPTTPGNGFRDVGSTKFTTAKWVSTGVAGTLIGASIVSYIMAGQQASNLEADATNCPVAGQLPPCRPFDADYDAEVQKAGKRYNTIHQVTLVVGVGAAAVAGYFWYRELTAKKHGDLKVSSKKSPEPSWAITPAIGDGFTGATALATF